MAPCQAAQPARLIPKEPGSCYILRMEITVKIPEELVAQARARGLNLEVYVQEILARQAAREGISQPSTPEEIRAWLDSLAQFSDKIPPLPEVISREWIYQDHN
jgi:post-segregation antitoxin (ccd killing protein)